MHTAHWETPESNETWLDVDPGNVLLTDGYFCVDRKLYVVRGGSFVRTAGTGTLNGLSDTCEGASGVCTVRTEVLPLSNGTLLLLSGGKPIAKPGKLPNGLFIHGAAEPPQERVDLILDRPFLFVHTNSDGLPLFVGIVNEP